MLLNEDINAQCSTDCPLECDSINYELSMSTANFPTRVFAKLLRQREHIRRQFEPNETITYEKLKESVLALDINYAELKYTVMSESASKTIIDLIASIGGTIGLFLGTSLLGIVDVIEDCYVLVMSLRKKRSRRTLIDSLNRQSNNFIDNDHIEEETYNRTASHTNTSNNNNNNNNKSNHSNNNKKNSNGNANKWKSSMKSNKKSSSKFVSLFS